jgi:hypothetical protein
VLVLIGPSLLNQHITEWNRIKLDYFGSSVIIIITIAVVFVTTTITKIIISLLSVVRK